MKRLLMTTALAGSLVLGIISGCAKDENLVLPNTPPETFIAIADSITNPTAYIQDIHWWGEDIDGEVVGYEYRWFLDETEPGCPMDTVWVYTEDTSREFHIPVTNGVVRRHRLQVRAIDNRQVADRSPCELVTPVFNTPPVISLRDAKALPDTTYPAILVKWDVEDAEGIETVDSFKAWLDGNEENAKHMGGGDSAATFGFEDFQDRYGERTLYLRGVDTGCDSSNLVTHTWHVKEPVGDVLIVDDLWSASGTVDFITNGKYMNLMKACAGTFSKLDLEAFDGVTYAHNYDDLFEIFDLVIWYDDPVRAVSATLPFARDAVGNYASGGGSFMLVSLTAVGPQGAFADAAMFEVFGIDSLFFRVDDLSRPNTSFDCKTDWNIIGSDDFGLGSLAVTQNILGAKCMAKRESSVSLYHLPPYSVDVLQDVDYYVALLNYWGAGKVAVFTVPLSNLNAYGTLENEFCKIIDLMID